MMPSDPTIHDVIALNDEAIAALSFEQALAHLESIIAQLETGEMTLEESINLYATGTQLRQHCEERLNAARLRVEQMTPSAAETPIPHAADL